MKASPRTRATVLLSLAFFAVTVNRTPPGMASVFAAYSGGAARAVRLWARGL